jgi:hypothetical protein
MAGNLMPFIVHSFNEVHPPGVRIDSAMTIVSTHEEGGLEAILFQGVEDLTSVDVGSVIECNSNSARLRTCANTSTTIWDVPLLWTRIINGAFTGLARLQYVALQ